MRSLVAVFFAFLLLVPSAVFAQNYGGNYAGTWRFTFDGEIRTPSGGSAGTLTVNALTVTLPSPSDSGGFLASRAGIPNAGPNSYVEFKSHPSMPGSLLITICYYGPTTQYIGQLIVGGVSAQTINQRQTLVGAMTIRVIPNALGMHQNTGLAWVTISPN